LWSAIKAIQQLNPDTRCVVYTGDDVTKEALLKKIRDSFGMTFARPENISLVKLQKRPWVEAERYPMFTMLGQALGSMLLGWEAISKLSPHVMLDTMGYAFTYPIFSLFGGCRVGCYVHYPTISTDMLSKVIEQRPSYNNNERISQSRTLSMFKYTYYLIFSLLYGFMGRFSNVVMVNSKWTQAHIKSIWGGAPAVVYPPCDTTTLTRIPLNWRNRENVILSIGQFRPEKDHAMQLRIIHTLLRNYPALKENTKLVLVGSCRNEEDKQRIRTLRALALELHVQDCVEFKIGISIQDLREHLGAASVGLHTMWNEHFGIGIVELMAAGVIPVAHNSGGPKSDIIKPNETGFLAATEEEYADRIAAILNGRNRFSQVQQDARASVDRFSEEEFINRFKSQTHVLLHNLH